MLATLMTPDSSKGYRALRQGRYSQGGGEYFVTFCSADRQTGLTADSIAASILSEIGLMEAEHIWTVRCAVIMPDHIHLLIQLGEKLSLGRTIARLKSKSTKQLKPAGLHWQEGYFEHHMRPNEERLPVFHYIYLNPYRAKLLPEEKTWPWFVCGPEDQAWFSSYLNQGLPEPTWLAGLR